MRLRMGVDGFTGHAILHLAARLLSIEYREGPLAARGFHRCRRETISANFFSCPRQWHAAAHPRGSVIG
jgi:hypothetical protein